MPGYTLTLQPMAIHTSPINTSLLSNTAQAGSLDACLCPFSYQEMLHFAVLIFPRRLITFVSDLCNFNPVWTSP